MESQRHGREFKLEAVRLVREGGVTAAQVAGDLGIHPNLLRNWVKTFEASPQTRLALNKKLPAERLIVLGRLYPRSLLGLGGLVGTNRSVVVQVPEPPATTPAAAPSAATCISRR